MFLVSGDCTGLVIFGITVHLPQIIELRVGQNIFRAKHCRHHGVVLIIIFVHAIATDEMQIRITIVEFLANCLDVRGIIIGVHWISLLLSNNAAVNNIAFLGEANFNQLSFRQVN